MYVGALLCDIVLGDVRSLKAKRSVVRPIIAELVRRYGVSAAETGFPDRHRRTRIAVALVSSSAAHCGEVLDACERLIAARPDVELLSARRWLHTEEEDSEPRPGARQEAG